MGELKQSTFELLIALVVALSFIFIPSVQAVDLTLHKDTPVHVFFSPNGGCTQAITDTINRAKSEILVQAYILTSAPIAKALVDVHKRGVKVFVILDKKQKKNGYSSATFFKNQGIPTYIDSSHAGAHDKVMILDQETVITGSFNFSKSAETQNAENVLIIESAELAKIYWKNWMKHRDHSAK